MSNNDKEAESATVRAAIAQLKSVSARYARNEKKRNPGRLAKEEQKAFGDPKKAEKEFQEALEEEHIRHHRVVRRMRVWAAASAFAFLVCWSIAFWRVVFLSGNTANTFMLSDSVIMSLVTGTTVNVLGLCIIIVKGLFNTLTAPELKT